MTSPSPNSDSTGDRIARPRSALRRGAVTVAVLTFVVLGITACGSGSPKSSASSTSTTAPAASSGTSSTAPTASSGTSTAASAGGSTASGAADNFLQRAVAYAQCMRSHGVANFPDPDPNGGAQPINPPGVDTNSPTYKAAVQACKNYLPTVGINPNQQGQGQTQQLQFAQCMRTHGITNFPDPKNAPGPQSLSQYGIDTNSSAFKAADKACGALLSAGTSGP